MESYKRVLLVALMLVVGGCRLTVGIDGDGSVASDNGKISCPGDCKGSLKRGKEVTLTATANEGSYFSSWQGCDEEDGETCVVVGRMRNVKVTANFAEDLALQDADLSDDIKNCLADQNIELTEKTSSVTELSCDGDVVGFGGEFDSTGIELLANLTDLTVKNTTIDTLSNLTKLNKLKTLKLNDMGLTSVLDLRDLNSETLSTLDLQNNPEILCSDVATLEEVFGKETVYVDSQQCPSL